jgi:hypothetical protein
VNVSSSNGHNGNGQSNGKTGIKRRPGAGKGGIVPPVEHRFKNGNPGGPGRPQGSVDIWARIRRELLALETEGEGKGKQLADLIAKQFVKDAAAGRWPQLQELINREEGKTPDKFDGDLTVRIIRENEDAERDSDSTEEAA